MAGRIGCRAAALLLADRDPVLARLVAEAGLPEVPVAREPHFATLVRSTVHQQLATAAARARLSDSEITARLVTVRGIGKWSADIFLLFRLRRMDVWPTGDLAVRKGYGPAWAVPEPTEKQLIPLGEPYRPYRSVVAWYCWQANRLHGHRVAAPRPESAAGVV